MLSASEELRSAIANRFEMACHSNTADAVVTSSGSEESRCVIANPLKWLVTQTQLNPSLQTLLQKNHGLRSLIALKWPVTETQPMPLQQTLHQKNHGL